MLHFSPRFGRPARQIVRLAAGRLVPANDNGANDTATEVPDDTKVLAAALRLFAAHGLSAAAQAGHLAEQAAHAGDARETAWWLAVCRALDRRHARNIARRRECGAWPEVDPARAS